MSGGRGEDLEGAGADPVAQRGLHPGDLAIDGDAHVADVCAHRQLGQLLGVDVIDGLGPRQQRPDARTEQAPTRDGTRDGHTEEAVGELVRVGVRPGSLANTPLPTNSSGVRTRRRTKPGPLRSRRWSGNRRSTSYAATGTARTLPQPRLLANAVPHRHQVGVEPEHGVVDEDPPVDLGHVDSPNLAGHQGRDRLREVGRQPQVLGEVVERAEGEHGEHHVRVDGCARRAAHRAVAAGHDHGSRAVRAIPAAPHRARKVLGIDHLDGGRRPGYLERRLDGRRLLLGFLGGDRSGTAIHQDVEAHLWTVPRKHRCQTGPMAELRAVRVVVADDHQIWRSGLRADLGDAFAVIGEAGDADEAIAVIRREKPDLVVCDLHMPGGGGIKVAKECGEQTPIVMLTVSEAERDLLDAVAAGAQGYLVKSTPVDELRTALYKAAQGEPVFSPSLAALVLGEFRRMHKGAGGTQALSEREREVLQLVARGHTYKEIGEQLFIAQKTVENHVRNILAKLHLSRKQELIRYALDHGIE